jgi:hypothetical protein
LKNIKRRKAKMLLFYFLFCCRFLVAEWCKIHGREVAGRLHCSCHRLQEVENKEQLSIFPAKTPAVAASVTVSPLFTVLHPKAFVSSTSRRRYRYQMRLPTREKFRRI